jgi:hypothetical protein
LTVIPAARATPDGYFTSLRERYELAAQRCGQTCRDLVIGPGRLRVCFAGSELAEALLGPLQRLVAPSGDRPDAEIHVWDSAVSETPPPTLPQPPVGPIAPGETPRYRSVYAQEGGHLDSLAMFDTRERIGRFWFADRDQIRWYERAEPLRTAMHWALTSSETFLAHASAVGDERGAIVLTGRGGSGKTTTTLAALDAGLRVVGDNYVLVSLTDPGSWVYGLFGTAKLWPPTLDQLPWLAPMVVNPAVAAEEKLVADLGRHRPDGLATGLPVRAVVVPQVADSGPTRISRCSPVQALLALAPATMLQLPRADRGFAGMSELVRRVPTFELTLGSQIMDGPRALSELLTDLGR